MAALLGAPRKGYRKEGRFKNPEGGIDEANRPMCTMLPEISSSKGTAPTANPSNTTPAEAKERNMTQLGRGP